MEENTESFSERKPNGKLRFPSNFFLEKVSNNECKCFVCGKRYPIEKMEEVKAEMMREMSGKTILTT